MRFHEAVTIPYGHAFASFGSYHRGFGFSRLTAFPNSPYFTSSRIQSVSIELQGSCCAVKNVILRL